MASEPAAAGRLQYKKRLFVKLHQLESDKRRASTAEEAISTLVIKTDQFLSLYSLWFLDFEGDGRVLSTRVHNNDVNTAIAYP
jgi:hypothetical protein